MMTALIPGSYNPITLGHMDIITRTAQKFDRVVVAVMTNDMHKYVPSAPRKHYLFNEKERLDMTRLACAHLPNVEVISATGMLIDLVDTVGADLIIKGVRNEADFAYEQEQGVTLSLETRLATSSNVRANSDAALEESINTQLKNFEKNVNIYEFKLCNNEQNQQKIVDILSGALPECFHISEEFSISDNGEYIIEIQPT